MPNVKVAEPVEPDELSDLTINLDPKFNQTLYLVHTIFDLIYNIDIVKMSRLELRSGHHNEN